MLGWTGPCEFSDYPLSLYAWAPWVTGLGTPDFGHLMYILDLEEPQPPSFTS